MGISKVVYGNSTLVDLTDDTVSAEVLASGYTAHNAAGNRITGTATIVQSLSDVTSLVTWDTNYVASHSDMKVWLDGNKLLFSGKIVLKTGITIQGGFFATLDSSIAAKAGSVFSATYTANDASSPEKNISIYMHSTTQLRFSNNYNNSFSNLTQPTTGNVVRFSSVIPLN